jgi:CheY-like chemotaxis protein
MKTILIVDDYEVVRLYHSMFLSQKGYRCIPASDGKEALALLKQQRVDLVLLDLVMPNMSGQEVIGTSARSPNWPRSRSSRSPPRPSALATRNWAIRATCVSCSSRSCPTRLSPRSATCLGRKTRRRSPPESQ